MHIQTTLVRKSPYTRDMDSVAQRSKAIGKEKDVHLLERAETLWNNLDEFRRRRARATRFAYGDQWGDTIEINGTVMTQRQYLQKQGNVVLQTNQIKNKVDTIVGLLVKEQNEPVCVAIDKSEQQYGEMVTEGLKANCKKNKLGDLYDKFIKELCIGGLAVSYESYDSTSGTSGRLDSWTRYVEPNTVFFDSEMTDPRFWDMSLIGQFFDLSPEDLAARFARGEKDFSILRTIYANQFGLFPSEQILDMDRVRDESNIIFRESEDRTKCRVYEIWTKETRPRIRLHDTNEGSEEVIDADDYAYRKQIKAENMRRRALAKQSGWDESEVPYITGDGFGDTEIDKNGFFIDEFWYCRFLSPDGTILWEGESPYADRLHPFTICATPFIDGKILGYMNDAIDHNIAINRAIVLHDWLIRSQAKGVTVVPKAIVPDDMSLQEFANSWTCIDDMVFIDVKPGEEGLMPKVFTGSAQTFNISELIKTYSSLMENSTAITGAIQGKTPYAGTSGALYAQMAANSSTPVAGLLAKFRSFLESMHIKKMKNIVKFYSPERWKSIVSTTDIIDASNMHLNDVADMEYDISIIESTTTPSFKAATREDLKQFLLSGFISFDEYLQYSDEPYAESMLQKRQAMANQAQEQQPVAPQQV